MVIGTGAWTAYSFRVDASPLSSLFCQQKSEQPEVLMYASGRCPYCAAARRFFNSSGIRFTELNIEKSREAYERHRKLGARGVPTIVIDGEPMFGYNEQKLRKRLKPWIREG